MKLTLEHLKKFPEKMGRFDKVRIWSGEHRAWWGPDSRGYLTDIRFAGIYTIQEAWQTTKHCCPKKKISFHSVSKRRKA